MKPGHVLGVGQRVEAVVERRRGAANGLKTRGRLRIQLVRDGEIIKDFTARNGVVNEGKNRMLDTMFHNVALSATWYIGMINNTPTPTLLDADTLASHTGWAEVNPTAGNRLAWNEEAAGTTTDGAMGSASNTSFTINATATLAGIFVCDQATGTAGDLWATALFDEALSVVSGDTLNITYEADLNS